MLALFMIVGVAATLVWYNQDKVVAYFIREANKSLSSPVEVKKISLSLFDRFPEVSLTLEDVLIQGADPRTEKPLAKVDRIYGLLNLWKLIQGEMVIDQVMLKEGEVYLHRAPDGTENYLIFKKTEGGASGGAFRLSDIGLDRISVTYLDPAGGQNHRLFAEQAAAELDINGSEYRIATNGHWLCSGIGVDQDTFFIEKPLRLTANLVYEDSLKHLQILPSDIQVNDAMFTVNGTYEWGSLDLINIRAEATNSTLKALFSLLPQRTYEQLKAYESEGNVKFVALIEGDMSGGKTPKVNVDFSAENTSLFHPEYSKRIENMAFEGHFTNGAGRNNKSSVLKINPLKGTVDNEPFSGWMELSNLDDYYLKCHLEGLFDAGQLVNTFKPKRMHHAKGDVRLDVDFDGRLADMEEIQRVNRVKLSGDVRLKDVGFRLEGSELPFEKFTGHFLFNKHDIAVSDFTGGIGSSNFELNGFFKNIISFLLFDNQSLRIEADMVSDMLDLNELLSGHLVQDDYQASDKPKYHFEISPKLDLDINCEVGNLKVRRFHGQQIKGGLRVRNSRATLTNGQVKAAGGTMRLNGTVDARRPQYVVVDTDARFDRIDIDSIFYIFENFNQDWLVDKNLKGQLYATALSHMVFDSELHFNQQAFESQVRARIRNGELNDFEPMQRLSAFVEEESLSNLRFSDIENDIFINNQTIHIPSMEVRSNVSTLTIDGTHTFDQHIDYHVKVPLRRILGGRRQQYRQTVANEQRGSHLFLFIRGTTSDYRIGYDTEAVEEKIKKDIRREGEELKAAFKNKGREKESVELEEEEFFEWDDQ
ncbi:AsmA-like C-terminal region-containing protein [Roseivirga sp. BDSF3-8]|uniref:AsmA-like C-terminal region-containing protein n=1 Tax=Roseivirga sp. BDSF3-8 TaxID=3241598 RepID=UPI00353192ED